MKRSIGLFDKVAHLLKRLVLDTDLSDEEGAALAEVTDNVNTVRENYVDRKVDSIVDKINKP